MVIYSTYSMYVKLCNTHLHHVAAGVNIIIFGQYVHVVHMHVYTVYVLTHTCMYVYNMIDSFVLLYSIINIIYHMTIIRTGASIRLISNII